MRTQHTSTWIIDRDGHNKLLVPCTIKLRRMRMLQSKTGAHKKVGMGQNRLFSIFSVPVQDRGTQEVGTVNILFSLLFFTGKTVLSL